MIIKSGLPFFPKEGIIFLDNCAFERENSFEERRKCSVSYIRKNTTRLESLTHQLTDMDNWCTIKEVLEEFIDGNLFFTYANRDSSSIQVKKAFKRFLKQREKFFQLISQEHVIADNNLIIELEDRINNITPLVEKRFGMRAGKTNEKKTDIKLISLALAYAKQDYSFIFSQDQILLKTFSDCAGDLILFHRTYVISDRFAKPVPTRLYETELKKVKRHKSIFIKYN